MATHIFYPDIKWDVQGVFTKGCASLPGGLADRVTSAYRLAFSEFQGYASSMWGSIDLKKGDVHAALTGEPFAKDAVARILEDPGATDLFWGVDPTFPEFTAQFEARPGGVAWFICDRLLRLGEAVGAVPAWLPDIVGPRTDPVDVPKTIAAIEQQIGGDIEFPNPFPREFGVATPRGVMAERALQAIFQAWRIRQLAGRYGGKILEIGAGLGRTAFCARAVGLADYTIVDLPMGLVIQAAFLGRVLPDESIAFPGEIANPQQVRMITPAGLLSSNERFDIVLNAFSMTEMDRDHAEAYAAFIAAHAKVFISINCETNPFRVCDLAPLRAVPSIRMPYWLHAGYVEELFFF